jgi:beta-1,4-mannosyl-glycoprotein beta-1,4-N-acetylglucosaminyltransferase
MTSKINERATICLNMIVKNESHIIERTLKNLCDKINFDYWVISDTGSTDNTPEIIENFFKSKNINGELHHNEWKNFAHNRTIALEQAYNKTDLLLIFDADDELHGDFKVPTEVNYDQYHLQFGDENGVHYKRVLLINNRKRFKYLSVVHEFITCCEANSKDTLIEGNYYVVSGRSGSRNKNPNKYLDDAKILEEAHKEALLTNDPLHLRYAFYCANSYKDSGKHEDAIKWYKITLAQNNWSQEKYMSCYYIYECYNKLDQQQLGFYYLVEGFKYDTERMECLYPLLVHYCCNNMNNVAYNYYLIVKDFYEKKYINMSLTDKLFLDINKYNFFVPYYMILIADKTQNFDTVIRMYEIIFEKRCKMFETWWIKNLLYNIQFFFKYASEPEFVVKANNYIKFLYDNKVQLSSFTFLRDYDKYGINLDYIFPKKITERTTIFNEDICKNSKNILIYSGFSEEDWNYSYMFEKALGGSEKAIAYIAKEFSKEYTIYVTGGVKNAIYDNVHYVHMYKLNELIETTPFYAVIVSRYISFFELFPNTSFYKSYLWGHDTHFLPYGCSLSSEQILTKWENYITGCICLTEWQRNNYLNAYPELKNKITLINNGIDIDNFPRRPFVKITNRFIYTSCSERGLKILLKLWPQILEKMPDASLVISSYNKFPKNDDEKEIKTIIEKYPSINHLGKLGVKALYFQMSMAEYWLYPCIFPETSCITALEMLMNEVICLYYPCAGLPGTMKDYGIEIKEGNELEKLFSITDEQKNNLKRRGRQYAESCSWKTRCRLWEKLLIPEVFDNTSNSKYTDPTEENAKLVIEEKPEIVIKANPIENDEWIFFAPTWYYYNILDDYMDSLKSKYNVIFTRDKNYVMNSSSKKVTFVMCFLDIDVVEHLMMKNVDISLLNTEPLTISKRLNDLLGTIKRCPHPNPKIYDYSLSNIGILKTYGITYTEHLPYVITKEENEYLSNLYINTPKFYDFGLISSDNPCSCIRRQDVVDFLRKHDFSVKIISGFKKSRDEQLAQCKIILNVHGKYLDEPSNIFEHIRCDRLLNAGFNILSEDNYKLDINFINKFSNLKIVEYNDFININTYNDAWFNFKQLSDDPNTRKIVDCFIFYNELDLLNYRLNVLNDVVDKFVLVEATHSHVGKKKTLFYEENKSFFSKFADKIIHVIVDDFPFTEENINISNNEQWQNEHHQRNSIRKGLNQLKLQNDDLIIIADLDEIPDPKTLKKLKYTTGKIEAYRLEQDFYYYNLNSKRQERWYHSKIISYGYMKEINISCQDVRFHSCPNLSRGGWHLSYFGNPEFIKNKLENFTHQEHNNSNIINIDHITKQINNCDDLFNRPGLNQMYRLDVEDNNYLPPMYDKYLQSYFKLDNYDKIQPTIYNDMKRINAQDIRKSKPKNYCFIHSCLLKNGNPNRLNYIIHRLRENNCIEIFEKIYIYNVGEEMENYFYINNVELINCGKSNTYESNTLNKLYHFAKNNPNSNILYLHTKGIGYSDDNNKINDWIELMLYFLVEKHEICTELLERGFDTIGCNYLQVYNPLTPPHYSGNFWWATTDYIKTLSPIDETSCIKSDAEFWLCGNNPKIFVIHDSDINHYQCEYPREKYID